MSRFAMVRRGARFFEQDEQLMIEIVLDGSTKFAPRIATPDDLIQHEAAYLAFLEPEPEVINPPMIQPIDHRTDEERAEDEAEIAERVTRRNRKSEVL